MKKKMTALAALLLALCMLCGCSINPWRIAEKAADILSPSDSGRDNIPDFDDMEYSRPDVTELEDKLAELEDAMDRGRGFKTISDIVDDFYELYCHFETMLIIADIHNCRDLTDSYYAEEYSWCSGISPYVMQLMEELYYACGTSEIADKLEEDVFWEGFAEEYSDPEDSIYTDGAVELMGRESDLISRYRELSADPEISLPDGRTVSFGKYMEDAADNGWEYYWQGIYLYYSQYNQRYSDIFTELVKVRNALAHELDYDSYEQMQYEVNYERDYSPEDAAAYLEDIKLYMVPFYNELYNSGLYADYTYMSVKKTMQTFEGALDSMGSAGEKAREAFGFMKAHRLYDIEPSPLKANTSFQTYIDDYEAPFLFMDAAGDSSDLLTFSHEFGHYLDAYVNYNAGETVDVAETFSQAMEYLSLNYYGDSLQSNEIDKLRCIKALDTVNMYVQQASYSEFESTVYAADPEELNAEFFNSLYLRLAEEYGCYSGDNPEFFAMGWMDIMHIFEAPFYMITYPVSDDAAMQIYALETEKSGAGLEKYMEMLPREYEGFIETVTEGGLESPVAPGRVKCVVNELRGMIWPGSIAA